MRASTMVPGLASPVHVEIGEAQMMGPTVDTIDDRIGGALHFVVQLPPDQPAEHHRIGGLHRHGARSP